MFNREAKMNRVLVVKVTRPLHPEQPQSRQLRCADCSQEFRLHDSIGIVIFDSSFLSFHFDESECVRATTNRGE